MKILLSVLPLLVACVGAEGSPESVDSTLRIGVVLPPHPAAIGYWQGAELGGLEAVRAAELVGRSFELLVAEAASPAEAREEARRLAERGAFALVGGTEPEVCRELSAAAEALRVLFVNVGCRDDTLRDEPGASTFHVQASEWMYREAAVGSDGTPAAAVLWHPELFRFGAAQLNDRFETRFGTPPAEGAWAAWMAIKLLWESAARLPRASADAVAADLLDENTRFDGHKGQSLTFDPTDHQLRQPLYLPTIVAGAAVPVEVDPLRRSETGLAPDEWAALDGRSVPAGSYVVVVSNEGSGDVTIISQPTGEVVSRIRVGSRPRGIRADRDGRHVYVALSDDAPTVATDEDGIAVIDLRAGRVVDRYAAGSDPEQFALTPDGRTLIAANEDAGTATATDVTRGEALATMIVGIEPEGVAVSPDGRWVYVTAETSNTVSVIDVTQPAVVASFLVDVRPRAAAFSPTLPRAYVTNEISGTLSVVDTNDHRVIDTIEMPNAAATPVGVVAAPDGSRVYVAMGHANSVAVIDVASGRAIGEIPVGRRPWGIDATADGRWIYVANGLTNDVSVIDAAKLEVVRTIPVGERPWGVAVVTAPPSGGP